MTTYYRVDGGQLTYAEYWRMAPDLFSFCLCAGLKLIRCPMRFNFAIPRPDRLFVVDFYELPRPARSGLGAAIDAAERAGLRLVFCHRLAVPEPHRVGAAALLVDEDREYSLMAIFGQDGAMRENQLSIASRFADGSLACTTTMKKTMVPTPESHMARFPGVGPRELLRRHREHLDRLAEQGLLPVPLDEDRLEEFVLQCELRYVDFHIGRGVFVPMTDEEVEAVSGR